MPAFALCDVATIGSRPPHCKPKQMSDEGKGLVLHNGGARHYVRAEEFEEIHYMLQCSQIFHECRHLMKMTDSMEAKQNVIRALLKRLNMSSRRVRSRVSPRAGQITARGENTHRRREKKKAERATDTSRPTDTGEARCLWPRTPTYTASTHTYTHTARRNVRTRCGPHTAEQICLKGRSCVYRSLHPARRNICEQAALFFLSVFSVRICILYIHVHERLLNHWK